MNRSLEVFNKIYKPYKIHKKNNVYILNTMDGDYVIKLNPKIDYQKLYSYLYSRSFNYVPDISKDSRDDMLVLAYQEDLSMNKNQKALDLINLVSLLHNKTSYFKNVTNDTYKEIYDNIKNNLVYLDSLYDGMFMKYLDEEYSTPSHYLFLRNYSLIYNAIHYSYGKLDEWYSKIKDKNRQRVVLVHNNLQLDHLIKNKNEYLISWDSYTFDTPVLDLYHLYLNEWEDVEFSEVFNIYNDGFSLLEEERMLLDLLISIPMTIEITEDEYNNCRNIRRMIECLGKSSKIVLINQ